MYRIYHGLVSPSQTPPQDFFRSENLQSHIRDQLEVTGIYWFNLNKNLKLATITHLIHKKLYSMATFSNTCHTMS